ncbi:MAG: VTT domain-containing protein [Candidatus Gastranaerophilales bacterium]|nr:VTT domain-containing protein [Candidatus Gastranaerophilales bacterium]
MHEIFMKMNEIFQSMGVQGLALNSFIESFFLVPPPDFLLIVMDLANPSKALYYALICTIASAFGGGIGYAIGYWGGRPAFNWFFRKGGKEKFEAVENLYNKYGVLAVFFSAFTPIPYKVFTIASGILSMNFWKFMLASFFGRGLRFFIVSLVLMLFGEAVKQYIEVVIIAVSIVIVLFFVILYKKRKSLFKP